MFVTTWRLLSVVQYTVHTQLAELGMASCVGCGCDVEGKEKKNRMVLRGPDVKPEIYSLWEDYFDREVAESGRDLSDFQDHLRSERAYLCRPCQNLFLKLNSMQNKIAERIAKAVVAIEGYIKLQDNSSRKRKAPAPLCNAPPAKRPLFPIGTSPPIVVCPHHEFNKFYLA